MVRAGSMRSKVTAVTQSDDSLRGLAALCGRKSILLHARAFFDAENLFALLGGRPSGTASVEALRKLARQRLPRLQKYSHLRTDPFFENLKSFENLRSAPRYP